jgi:uncharacterized damage-inducible protein DinB
MLPEVEHYLERIEDLRGQIIDLIRPLPVDALNWRPIEETADHATNSLAVMATHVAGAEHFWIGEVIGHLPQTRQRETEFMVQGVAADQLVDRLQSTGRETREILARLTLDVLGSTEEAGGRTVPVRWAILHVIDHTALHLGHMQLTYQLWAGGQGIDAPRWFQRVPPAE